MGTRIKLPDLQPSPDVLLLVDFINPLDFPGADKLAPHALAAARATAALRRRLAGSQRVQTVFANDNYGIWRSDFKELWARCRQAPGIPGEVARRLRLQRDDCTILKPRHSAFYATPLELLLQLLKCRRLIVTGVAADSCVLFTAMDAYLRGYSVWVPEDCVAAEEGDAKQSALEHMQRVLKADIRASVDAGGRRKRRR